MMVKLLPLMLLTFWAASLSSAFLVVPPSRQCVFRRSKFPSLFRDSVALKSTKEEEDAANANDDNDDDWMLDDEELEILFEGDDNEDDVGEQQESEGPAQSLSELEPKELDNMERAWRYAGKPLLRIGSKGASDSHGNSLRELLEAHTAVKVKINTRKFETLEGGFEVLKMLAEDSGAPPGIELIQARETDSIIMCALPGTMEKIINGEFPPPEDNSDPTTDEDP